ncbi:MAG TPA: cardiolipin synthase [Protaetiibacter sp.]|nr:cardiolipin synthase [Protaetiibacter sp.]
MDGGLAAWLSLATIVALIVIDLGVRIAALIIVPRNRRPQTAMAWLLAIFFIPYVGVLFFLMFGSARLPRNRRRKQREINEYILEVTEGIDLVKKDPSWPPWLEPLVELNRTLGAMPFVGGNSARMWTDTREAFAAMTEQVRRAKRVVHVEFYILSLDETTRPFFQALADARARGVKVRVLLDHLGNLQYPGYRRTKRFLTAAGIEWHLMLPLQPLKGRFQRPDLRNHRKLLVVDGDVAFTGSLNVIEPAYQRRKNHRRGLEWKDYWVRFEGPVVAGLDAIFATDWYSETDELLVREVAPVRPGDGTLDCQVVPSGPGFPGENNLRLFNSLVYNAQRRIVLVSPYFVPDDSMLYAVTTAAQSGVEVELFVSEIGDQFFVYHAQRSYYEMLLKAGVKIYLYPSPTVLHAKHMTFDGEIAVIGSSNMDMRSFTLNLEVSVMIHGEPFLTQLREVEDAYRAVSRELTLEEWRTRSFRLQTVDNLMRLTAGLQ